jgi:hypothetical protein
MKYTGRCQNDLNGQGNSELEPEPEDLEVASTGAIGAMGSEHLQALASRKWQPTRRLSGRPGPRRDTRPGR